MQNKGIRIARLKNRFAPPLFNGYRDFLMNFSVVMPSGEAFICELQLHHAKIKDSEALLKSHTIYEFFRTYFSGNMKAVEERLETILKLPVEGVNTIGKLVSKVWDDFSGSVTDLQNLKALLDSMSEIEHSVKVQRQLVELWKPRSGEESAEYASALNNLATLLKQQVRL